MLGNVLSESQLFRSSAGEAAEGAEVQTLPWVVAAVVAVVIPA